MHPLPECRFRQIEVARDRADALAFVEHQPDSLRFEVVIEPATRSSPLGRLCHRCGHRIRLSESVHETGSSPRTESTCNHPKRTCAGLAPPTKERRSFRYWALRNSPKNRKTSPAPTPELARCVWLDPVCPKIGRQPFWRCTVPGSRSGSKCAK